MTAVPELAIDDSHETMDLVLKIDPGAQYRIGSVDFLGVNAVTREKLIGSLPKSGQIFDRTRFEDFFKLNRAILPSDVSTNDMSVRRNLGSKTLAILFDFRNCPHSN